ncbi:Uncharacterised protein [Shigella sonnei]|nr:Uncharacterised protein [Shigella sonnei]
MEFPEGNSFYQAGSVSADAAPGMVILLIRQRKQWR